MQVSPLLNMLLSTGSMAGSSPFSLFAGGMEVGAAGFNTLLGVNSASTKAPVPEGMDALLNNPQGDTTTPLAGIALPQIPVEKVQKADVLDLTAVNNISAQKKVLVQPQTNEQPNLWQSQASDLTNDDDFNNKATNIVEEKSLGKFTLKEIPITVQQPLTEVAKLAHDYTQKRLAAATPITEEVAKPEASISKLVAETSLQETPEKQALVGLAKPQEHAKNENSKIKFDVDVIDAHESEYSRHREVGGHKAAEEKISSHEVKSPIEQVSLKISQGITDGVEKIHIKLQPQELGKVDVEMKTDKDGKMEIHILADRSDTLDLLRRDSHDLERALRDSGIRTDMGSLQFSMRDQNKGGNEFGQLIPNKPLNLNGFNAANSNERDLVLNLYGGGINLVA